MSDSRKDRPSATPEPLDGAGKGRPTPKRSQAQEANKRPLVPSDRKAAYKADREKRKAARAKANEAMITGDDRYLPARDRGPMRRYARDYVDARWSLGEFFLPASIGIVAVVLLGGQRPTIALTAILVIYLAVVAAVVDAVVLTRKLKKRMIAKYGDYPKGTGMYAAMRAFQIRRTRMPRPMVSRREYPA